MILSTPPGHPPRKRPAVHARPIDPAGLSSPELETFTEAPAPLIARISALFKQSCGICLRSKRGTFLAPTLDCHVVDCASQARLAKAKESRICNAEAISIDETTNRYTTMKPTALPIITFVALFAAALSTPFTIHAQESAAGQEIHESGAPLIAASTFRWR
jgi:hypothetical protein